MENTARDAEAHIQALIERWANAVQQQDLETIIADHATDLVSSMSHPRTNSGELRPTAIAGARSSSTQAGRRFRDRAAGCHGGRPGCFCYRIAAVRHQGRA